MATPSTTRADHANASGVPSSAGAASSCTWVGLNQARPVRTRAVPSSSTFLPATVSAESEALDAASDEAVAADLDAAEAAVAWSSTVRPAAPDDIRTMARTGACGYGCVWGWQQAKTASKWEGAELNQGKSWEGESWEG
eukprot:scaffold4526_cov56-Phaeocystis_antarctica.AAC.1